MQKLELAPTKTTPGIKFDPETNLLEFYGHSYPTNPVTFFQPLMEWVESYIDAYPETPTKLVFRMEYFNTSSSTFIFKILELLDMHHQQYKNVQLVFECEDQEDDVLDAWKSLIRDFDLPCEIKILR